MIRHGKLIDEHRIGLPVSWDRPFKKRGFFLKLLSVLWLLVSGAGAEVVYAQNGLVWLRCESDTAKGPVSSFIAIDAANSRAGLYRAKRDQIDWFAATYSATIVTIDGEGAWTTTIDRQSLTIATKFTSSLQESSNSHGQCRKVAGPAAENQF